MSKSVLLQQRMRSPLESTRRLQGKGSAGKDRSLFFSLNMTALIDAFCILVIFLLSNMKGQVQNLNIGSNMVLPSAVKTEVLENGLVLRIERDEFFLDNQKIKKERVAQALFEARKSKNSSLIIQADRRSDYESIAMVLRAGGQAGYEKYIFAVLPGT